MRHLVRLLLAAAACAVASIPAQAQTPPVIAPHLQIPRVSTPPTIDDYLAGGSHPGLAVTAFTQRQPEDLEPATERTTAHLSYDDENVYAGFVCDMSSPSRIRAHMAKREAVFNDDFVGIMLDTFLDRQRSYLFFVTPLGIQADGITTDAAGDDYSFDTEWHSEGRLTPTGFVVWMAVPFKALR